MVEGANADAVGVFGFVVEDSVGFKLIILNRKECVIRSTNSAYKAIGKGITDIGINCVEGTDGCADGLIFVDGVGGEG